MPQLQVLSGKRQGFVLDFADGEVVDVGNRKTAKLSIRDPWISWNHAKISVESGKFFVEDVGSSNGTWVNGEKIKRRELKANDVIYFGKTKVKFAAAAASAPAPAAAAAPAGAGPEAPWWDKVIDGGGAPAGSPEAARALEGQLHEERKMRQALERFLDVPPGTALGDAAKAGALEARVAELERELAAAKKAPAEDGEAVEKVRRELMTKLVELETRASAAEAQVAELEGQLKERTSEAKKEIQRVRARHDDELETLKKEAEEARASASKLAAGGDEALTAERGRADRLQAELDELREKHRAAEQRGDDLARELDAAKALGAGSGAATAAIQAALDAATAEVAHWKEEHARVVQEIDEISMEQIEIEDGLKREVAALKERLGEGSGGAAEPVEG